MSEPIDSDPERFVRLEGFFDPQRLEQIQALAAEIGTKAMIFEVLPLRDRDVRGQLLEKLPDIGHVVTYNVLRDFSKRVPGVANSSVAAARSNTIFGAAREHVSHFHNSESGCTCGLRMGRYQAPPRGRYQSVASTLYIEPISLVAAYRNGLFEGLPVSFPSAGQKTSKTLVESICWPILPAYINALTH